MGLTTFYQWIWDRPLILRYTEMDRADIGDWLPHERVYRLPFHAWHRTADQIERDYRRAQANRPNHMIHHLLNEREICRQLTARGVPATLVNHNALLDERLYQIEHVAKRFDAVYNARMAPFKRHWLARDIPRLLVIGGVHAADDSPEYFAEVRAALPRATFTHASQLKAHLSPEEVSRWLNQARVGLCLSAREGTMYAATEYLLCGLPVVTTRNVGGRDEWFDTRFARTVADDPAAIAAAVAELASLNLSPAWIRQETLRRVCVHRQRFVELLQNILDVELAGVDFAREWYARFSNKLGAWRPVARLMSLVEQDCGWPALLDGAGAGCPEPVPHFAP